MIKLTQEEQKYLLDSIRIIPDFPKKELSLEILPLY